MFHTIKQEIQELRQSNKDDIEFAIEAIRLNLVAWAYKDETLLYEAMRRLLQYQKRMLSE